MKYKEQQGMRVSVFSLGTVQLGMNYGIANTSGKPSHEQAFAMLDRAAELGVNHLDTSNDYGDSEQTIGQWLRTREEKPQITTKVGHFAMESEAGLEQEIRGQVEGCLRRLSLPAIPVLMLHDFEEYARHPDWMRRIFRKLKDEKLIVRSGISAYSRHDYGVIAQSGFDCVQIPLNIFDWNRISDGSLDKLAQAGMAVFVRSAFLQGLVFRDPARLEPEMEFCRPTLEKFRALCEKYGLRPEELAVSFLLSLPQITGLVLGCETIAQVEANAALMDRTVELSQAQMQEIEAAFRDTDPKVLNPARWHNAGVYETAK
ncbi:MAG: aldo/keto reductase [Oscillospiraceae bacterium]|nr:aldo/keto reductase [Oscillospiraceae bacterium]